MRYIKTSWDIPYFNMAFEEYLLESEKYREDILFFYVHRPSVIIGAHQNAYKEINQAFTEENNIIVARRLSGGGAVYHDGGNLNYSLILSNGNGIDLERFTRPLCEALNSLGAHCEFSGRNDITLDGKKISGAAQCMKNGRLLHHGTLMYDVDIASLSAALSPDKAKLSAKGVDSVRSRVANLKQAVGGITMEELKHAVTNAFSGNSEPLKPDSEDIKAVEKKVKEKFSLREYNYGVKYDFEIEKTFRCGAGTVSAGLLTDGNIIKKAVLTGDFFVTGDISITQKELEGAEYSFRGITNALCDTRIAGLTVRQLAEGVV